MFYFKGKEFFFTLLNSIKAHLIPTKEGYKGISINREVLLSTVLPFLKNFLPANRKCYMVKTRPKSYPYTGGVYLQLVWEISDLEQLERNFLSAFSNLKVPTEILWVQGSFERSKLVRIDEPRKSELGKSFYEISNEATRVRRDFLLEKLGTTSYTTNSVKLMVGEIAPKKTPSKPVKKRYKKISKCKITFTRSWESGNGKFVGGIFHVRFFHQVRKGGVIQGGFVSGQDTQKQDVIEQEIADDIVKKMFEED